MRLFFTERPQLLGVVCKRRQFVLNKRCEGFFVGFRDGKRFAGSSSVPAHVEMMGLIGMGNNPMVGATVACAVAVSEALK